MIIQYASDLHLEFVQNPLKYFPIKKNGDILILAGDVTNIEYRKNKDYQPFFDMLSKEFEQVYWIPGNHEYYGTTLEINPFYEEIRNNIFLLNNKTVTIEGINFIFSTMWGKLDPVYSYVIKESISDFKAIKGMNIDMFNHLHDTSVNFIKDALKGDNRNTVVVTHHVPTFFNYPSEYKGDVLNCAFGTELFDLIEEASPCAWIYGHHHVNVNEFFINETKLLTNQMGYYDKPCVGFDPQKNIKI
jgi:predicted MPP superfamily phosphohydrolase